MTIKDIAKESGYAVGTVSRVLNNQENVSKKARESILEIVNKYGFTINTTAKNLKQQSSKNIVIIVKGVNNRLFAAIIEKLQYKIEQNGFYAVVEYIDEDENEVERANVSLKEKKPQAIIFLGGVRANFEKAYRFIDVPSVLVTNSSKSFEVERLSSVSVDDKLASYEAVDFLFENGHHEIGVIGGKFSTSEISEIRLSGAKKAFAAHGMTLDVDKDYAHSRFSLEGGYKAMKKLLEKKPNLTAVFAMSDVMAIGAMRALNDLNKKVPEDVSIIGFDGIDITQFLCPRLSSIKQDEELLSEKTVELLMNILRGEGKEENVVVTHSLESRESVRKI